MILLDGKETSNKLYDNLLRVKGNRDNTLLIILTVGNDEASKVYVRNKLKACEKVGIASEHIILNDSMGYYEFSEYIENLISDKFYNIKSPYCSGGIILQLPAPKLYQEVFNQIVPPIFDVDGFGEKNQLYLLQGKEPENYPATPKGIMTLLDDYKINIEGKHVVIVGRSEIVGKPLALMMLNRNATVTICHSKTQHLEDITKTADILVAAIGKPKFINASHIKDGVTIVDVGINRTENGLCGDVDFDDVKDKCYAITPVPGGVGPMTVYSLIENVLTDERND